MDDDHVAPIAISRTRGPEPRASTFDEAPLLDGGALEVATEPVEGYIGNGHEESFSAGSSGLRVKRIIAATATVCLIVVVSACKLAFDSGTPAPAPPPQPDAAFTQAIRNDATSALTTHVHSHLLFQPTPPAATTSPSDSPTDTTQPATWSVWAATNLTIQPHYVSKALTIHVPPLTAASLLRLQIFGMDRECNTNSAMCLCGGGDVLPAALRDAVPEVSSCEPINCRKVLLQPLILPPVHAYEHQDWFKLHLPCTLVPSHTYTIEWLAMAEDAFAQSAPYPPAAASSTTASSTSADSQVPQVALFGSPKSFLPSTLASGSETSLTRFTVTAPASLTVLTGTEQSGLEVMHDNGMRTQRFKSVKDISFSMLGVAVGIFNRLATGEDAAGRRVSVWALPGAAPEDAQVPWQILSNATAAWAAFTGQPLPGLGSLDMLVWNGESQWSASQHGLLLMDRFRTLWNGGVSTASDLVRCAHVICHETGHLWFGGLLQTLNSTGKMFIEESTTSYAEVFCVAEVLQGPLGEREAFTRSFFTGFGDTRSLHTGAAFHAVRSLARPQSGSLTMSSGRDACYTKGPAFLHLLEGYADAAVSPGLMRDTLRRFFVSYAHSAVTAGDLLCHLAHALAGCPVGDASSPDGCKPPQPAPTLPEAPGDINITAPDAAAPAGSCAMVTPWRQRLDAWLVAPGIQVVEVSQGGTSPDTGMQLQALLQADDLPGQARDNVPLWVPVSLVHSTATSPSGATSNGSTGVDITRDQRWLEVFPPWEERHRTEVGGDPGCMDPGVEGGPACGRPLASPPLSVPSGNGVWLPKATAGPFLTSITDQATQDALVLQLREFKLSGDGHTITDGHADMAALQAFSSLLHDASTLFHAAPSAPRHAFLLDLLAAAFASKAPAQAGLAAYLLLGPATSALWDLQLAARGDAACSKKVAALEQSLIVHSGSLAWKRLLPRAKTVAGDPSTLSQDELFSRAIAARLVPRAAHYDADLATSVCSLLGAAPAENPSLEELVRAIKHTPDVQNIVLETALTAQITCNVSSSVEQALVEHLQRSAGSSGMIVHSRRSASFILAASHDRHTLKLLIDAAVLGEEGTVESGLRRVDRVTLMNRIVRSSMAGFRAAAEILQGYAETTDEWSGAGRAAFLAEVSPWAVTGKEASLPSWLPIDALRENETEILRLQKQSDSAAAKIICAAK